MNRKFIKFAGYVISFGLAVNLLYIFVYAYLNDYYAVVYVNTYGEAHIELILLPFTLLFCLVGLWFAWKDLKKEQS